MSSWLMRVLMAGATLVVVSKANAKAPEPLPAEAEAAATDSPASDAAEPGGADDALVEPAEDGGPDGGPDDGSAEPAGGLSDAPVGGAPAEDGELADDAALATDAEPVEDGDPGDDEVAIDDVDVPTGEAIQGRKGRRPRHTWIYSNLTAVRYNPLGLVNEFTTGWRYQLSKKMYSPLFRDSFVAAQLHTYLTPAYGRIGPKIDIQPVALLNLSATYDYTGYFGTFGLFQSYDSPTADWSDNENIRRDDSNDPAIDNYATTGHFITLSALLQAKVKNIAIRDNLKFYWADFDLRDGDTVYYHQTLDLPQPDRGWTLTNDLDLLYLFDFGLTVGARYTLTHAFYRERHFLEAEPVSRPNGPTHRIGPAILYTFFDRPDKRFNKPTLIVLSQFWARHRFRTGQQVSAAVPYLIIGFRFQGEFLPDPASWHKSTERKPWRRRRAKTG